jgi:hypothetical protein
MLAPKVPAALRAADNAFAALDAKNEKLFFTRNWKYRVPEPEIGGGVGGVGGALGGGVGLLFPRGKHFFCPFPMCSV